MESLYERWKKREDPNRFDDIVLKSVRESMYTGQRLIMLSVAEARPWDTSINIVAVFIKPWNQIAGYTEEKFIKIWDDYYTDMVIDGEQVTVYRISLHTYVTRLLEGDMHMYFAFRWWARAWFIDSHMREHLQKLHQYCMSQNTVKNILWAARSELDLYKTHGYEEYAKIAAAVFTVGAVKIMLRKKVFPKTHFSATEEFNHDIVDDVIFGRYGKANFGKLHDYISAQIKFLYERTERTDIQELPNLSHISGTVYQLRQTYAIKGSVP